MMSTPPKKAGSGRFLSRWNSFSGSGSVGAPPGNDNGSESGSDDESGPRRSSSLDRKSFFASPGASPSAAEASGSGKKMTPLRALRKGVAAATGVRGVWSGKKAPPTCCDTPETPVPLDDTHSAGTATATTDECGANSSLGSPEADALAASLFAEQEGFAAQLHDTPEQRGFVACATPSAGGGSDGDDRTLTPFSPPHDDDNLDESFHSAAAPSDDEGGKEQAALDTATGLEVQVDAPGAAGVDVEGVARESQPSLHAVILVAHKEPADVHLAHLEHDGSNGGSNEVGHEAVGAAEKEEEGAFYSEGEAVSGDENTAVAAASPPTPERAPVASGDSPADSPSDGRTALSPLSPVRSPEPADKPSPSKRAPRPVARFYSPSSPECRAEAVRAVEAASASAPGLLACDGVVPPAVAPAVVAPAPPGDVASKGPVIDVDAVTMAELKDELSRLGPSLNGNKAQLARRLQGAVDSNPQAAVAVAVVIEARERAAAKGSVEEAENAQVVEEETNEAKTAEPKAAKAKAKQEAAEEEASAKEEAAAAAKAVAETEATARKEAAAARVAAEEEAAAAQTTQAKEKAWAAAETAEAVATAETVAQTAREQATELKAALAASADAAAAPEVASAAAPEAAPKAASGAGGGSEALDSSSVGEASAGKDFERTTADMSTDDDDDDEDDENNDVSTDSVALFSAPSQGPSRALAAAPAGLAVGLLESVFEQLVGCCLNRPTHDNSGLEAVRPMSTVGAAALKPLPPPPPPRTAKVPLPPPPPQLQSCAVKQQGAPSPTLKENDRGEPPKSDPSTTPAITSIAVAV